MCTVVTKGFAGMKLSGSLKMYGSFWVGTPLVIKYGHQMACSFASAPMVRFQFFFWTRRLYFDIDLATNTAAVCVCNN